MGLMQSLRQWKKKKINRDIKEEDDAKAWSDTGLSHDYINFSDPAQRKDYLSACMDRMAEASEKLDELLKEYNVVTSHLQDTEEIDAMPKDIRAQIEYDARKIVTAQTDRNRYLDKKDRMPDEKYERLHRLEEEVEEGLSKMKKEEEYQVLVKKDLSRLDSEKYAYLYRLSEVENARENIKGMTKITFGALAVCMGMLLVMQFGFEMETAIGYLLMVAATAITLTVLFVKYSDATREKSSIETCIGKIITLQNKVKIRYVNNKNLLDYLYLKFGVEKSGELEKMWNQYSMEKKERSKFEKANEELTVYKKSLITNLHKYRIKAPDIWIKQAEALIDAKEMVEIRHELVKRRQALRKQMENNKEIAKKTQKDVKELAESYPAYRMEIMEMVSAYEEKFR